MMKHFIHHEEPSAATPQPNFGISRAKNAKEERIFHHEGTKDTKGSDD